MATTEAIAARYAEAPLMRSRPQTSGYAKRLPVADQIHVVDFFCGAGGTSWGFLRTRQSHLEYAIHGGIDIDPFALASYEANLQRPGIECDVRSLADEPEQLLSLFPDLDPHVSRPLVFIATPPCQGFSAHRKKDARDDPRNDLIIAFAKVLSHFLPDAFLLENVPEMLGGKYSTYYEEAEAVFLRAGYSLRKGVVDLSRFGLAQRRRRAIVLGSLSGPIDLPQPVFEANEVRTVRDAIGHLRPLDAGETDPDDPWHRAPAHTERILEKIRMIPADGGDRRSLGRADQLQCHQDMDEGAATGFTDVYGRLRWDAPSVTITAKSSTPSTGRFLHPDQHRNISLREAAILQGFPQDYEFCGPFTHQYRQVGEAFPPSFARFLAWQLLDHFRPTAWDAADGACRVTDATQMTLPLQETLGAARPDEQAHPDLQQPLCVVDAFCGAGGMALGFQQVGYEAAYAFDLDADAVSTFRQNVSDVAEVADAYDSELPATISNAAGDRDYVLVGGPPCQGFSQQRRGDHADARNDLVLRYAEIVDETARRPLAVVLENVTYLDSPRGRNDLRGYREHLAELGYVLFRHDVNSTEFGVPQLRRRIVLVALSSRYAGSYAGPRPTHPRRWPTVGEALGGLPATGREDSPPNHVPSNETAISRRRIAYVDQGGGRLSIPQGLRLSAHRRYDGHLDVYGRLDWFSQARTLTGGFDSFTRGEYAHPFLHRSITAREAARLQGFPDSFEFIGNRASVRRQLGNAVPPPLARAVARAIADALRIRDT